MKCLWLVALLLVCGTELSAQAVNSLTAAEKAQGWQLLFDGKTLNGWHPFVPPARAGAAPPAQPGAAAQVGSNPKPCGTAAPSTNGSSRWEVADGLLMPCGDPAGYLNSDRTFKNFVLSVEFKTTEDTNSGVFIRSADGNNGYEVQIWKQQPAGYNTGSIVGTAKTTREFKFRPDEWNRYQITADRDHIVVVLNGETTLDIHDSKFSEGNLRLQYQKFPIMFRNIKVRALP